jgi:hypothetical protein
MVSFLENGFGSEQGSFLLLEMGLIHSQPPQTQEISTEN